MPNPFDVIDGDQDSKEILIETLHLKGDKSTGLKEFLSDLEETEERAGSWWMAIDRDEKPRGALTVRYIEGQQLSYLRSIWTRVLRTEDQFIASKVLLDAWMRDSHYDIKKYQADLPLYSPLITSIQKVGFKKEKMLMAYYDLETNWMVSELPEGYLMRPVEQEELGDIYKNLVEPELDPASPIFVSEERFMIFVNRLPPSALESWVVVENEVGKVVGFAASFINMAPTKDDEEPDQAVLFGPYSSEAKVQTGIVKEMMTYWKIKGIENLRIIRGNEFYPSITDEIEMKLVNSTVRFILNK